MASAAGVISVAGSAVQVAQNFSDKVPPGLCWNSQLAVQAIDKLRHLDAQGALLIFGRELSLLDSLKLAPEYYE